jgi:hypothetical protein
MHASYGAHSEFEAQAEDSEQQLVFAQAAHAVVP